MDEENENDRKQKRKRIDLSVAQVAGSALAAAIAAYLAGRLGVYGTIIGAGLVSVVATTGGSIFQHLFRRTGEQIKEASVTTRPKPRRSSSPHPRSTTGAAARAQRTMVLPTFDKQGAPDDVTAVAAAKSPGPDMDRTQLLPQDIRAYRRDPAGAHPAPRPDEATRMLCPAEAAGGRPTDKTQLVPRLDDRTTAPDHAASRAGEAAVPPASGSAERSGQPEEISAATYGTRLRGWRRPALGALAVFVLAMGAVTGTELMTGSTPSGQAGTTLGRLTGVGGVQHQRPDGPGRPDPGRSTGHGTHGGSAGEPTPDPSGSGRTGSGSDSGSGAQSPSPAPSDGGKSSPDPETSPSGEPSPSHSSDGGSATGGDSGDGSTGGQDQGGADPNGAEQQTPAPDAS